MSRRTIYRLMLRNLFSYARKKPMPKSEEIPAHSFFTRTNFAIRSSETEVWFMPERKILSVLKKVWTSDGRDIQNHQSAILHLHHTSTGGEIWNGFLNDSLGAELPWQAKDKFIFGNSLGSRLSFSFFLLRLLLPLRILYRKKEWKQNLLMLPGFFVTVINLQSYIRHNKINELYYSGVYEPEANLLSFLLMSDGIKVNMALSGTPLFRFTRHLYCNVLLFTNAYQLDEQKVFSDTIRADEIKLLPPFTWRNFIGLYETVPDYDASDKIAVYTSGIWKRREKKIFFDPEAEQKEILILKALDRYLAEVNPKAEVTLYLHPVEKKTPEDFAKAEANYKAYIKSERFFIAPAGQPTDQSFHKADIAVITISNTVFERLFAGYKTLIVPFMSENFPIPDSALNKLAARSENEILEKLIAFSALSRADFFAVNSLQNYCYGPILEKINGSGPTKPVSL